MRSILCAASSAVSLPAVSAAVAAPAGNGFSEVTATLADSEGFSTLLAAIKVGATPILVLDSTPPQPSQPAPCLQQTGWNGGSFHLGGGAPCPAVELSPSPPLVCCAQAVKLGSAITAAPRQTFFAPNSEQAWAGGQPTAAHGAPLGWSPHEGRAGRQRCVDVPGCLPARPVHPRLKSRLPAAAPLPCACRRRLLQRHPRARHDAGQAAGGQGPAHQGQLVGPALVVADACGHPCLPRASDGVALTASRLRAPPLPLQILLNHVLSRALPGLAALKKGPFLATQGGHQLQVNASGAGTATQVTVAPRVGPLGRAHTLGPPLLAGAFVIYVVDKVRGREGGWGRRFRARVPHSRASPSRPGQEAIPTPASCCSPQVLVPVLPSPPAKPRLPPPTLPKTRKPPPPAPRTKALPLPPPPSPSKALTRPPRRPGSGGIGGGVATACLPTATTAAPTTSSVGCYNSNYDSRIGSLCYTDCPAKRKGNPFVGKGGANCYYCESGSSLKSISGAWKCVGDKFGGVGSVGLLERSTSNGYADKLGCAAGSTQVEAT